MVKIVPTRFVFTKYEDQISLLSRQTPFFIQDTQNYTNKTTPTIKSIILFADFYYEMNTITFLKYKYWKLDLTNYLENTQQIREYLISSQWLSSHSFYVFGNS